MAITFVNAKPWKQQYQFNAIGPGSVTGWATGTSLPATVAYSQAIVTKNRVYLLGKFTGASAATVYTAPINEDGTLGTWTTGTSLPAGLSISQVIVTKNRVYLLGGYTTVNVSTVYTAPINEDGTLGAWTTGTSLPAAVAYSQVVITKNRVYLLSGQSGPEVYTAPINEDGTLGTWTTGTSLPATVLLSEAITTKNRVYLLGGHNSSAVYTAPINEDGTLGTWTTGTSMPAIKAAAPSIVTEDRVWLLGGYTTSGVITNTVYTAPINEDGTLGTWTTDSALFAGLAYSQAVVTSSRVYLLGGATSGGFVASVYLATFTGGLNDYTGRSYIEAAAPTDLSIILSQQFGPAAVLAAVLSQPFASRLGAIISQKFRPSRQITTTLHQHFAACPLVSKTLSQKFSQAAVISTILSQPFIIRAGLETTLSQKFLSLGAEISITLQQPFAIGTPLEIGATLRQLFYTGDSAPILQNFAITATAGGLAISPSEITLQASRTAYTITARLVLPDIDDYRRCDLGAPLIVNDGEEWIFKITEKSEQDELGNTTYLILGESPAVDLADELLIEPFGPGIVEDLAVAMAARYGLTLEYSSVTGWPLLEGTMTIADQTAADALRQVGASVRAVLQSGQDGKIYFEPEYTYSTVDWPTCPVDFEINDRDHIFTVSETIEQRSGYNQFRVTDLGQDGINYRLEETPISADRFELRCYVVPWTDPLPPLTHSGGDWVTIEPMGVNTQLISSELVEIIAGVGNCQYPIYQIATQTYRARDLGTVTPSESGAIATDIEGESLLELSYLTRYHSWIVTSPREESVQFFIPEAA